MLGLPPVYVVPGFSMLTTVAVPSPDEKLNVALKPELLLSPTPEMVCPFFPEHFPPIVHVAIHELDPASVAVAVANPPPPPEIVTGGAPE
jgi:hypothetical protein